LSYRRIYQPVNYTRFVVGVQSVWYFPRSFAFRQLAEFHMVQRFLLKAGAEFNELTGLLEYLDRNECTKLKVVPCRCRTCRISLSADDIWHRRWCRNR